MWRWNQLAAFHIDQQASVSEKISAKNGMGHGRTDEAVQTKLSASENYWAGNRAPGRDLFSIGREQKRIRVSRGFIRENRNLCTGVH